jgi:hypothetical protein
MGIACRVDNVAQNPDRDSKQWAIGGAYKVNPFELMIGYDKDTTEQAGGDLDRKVSWIGGRYQMSGANAVSLAYYHDKRDDAAAATKGMAKLWIGWPFFCLTLLVALNRSFSATPPAGFQFPRNIRSSSTPGSRARMNASPARNA